jgi:hypothetical protein
VNSSEKKAIVPRITAMSVNPAPNQVPLPQAMQRDRPTVNQIVSPTTRPCTPISTVTQTRRMPPVHTTALRAVDCSAGVRGGLDGYPVASKGRPTGGRRLKSWIALPARAGSSAVRDHGAESGKPPPRTDRKALGRNMSPCQLLVRDGL